LGTDDISQFIEIGEVAAGLIGIGINELDWKVM
jgi:hypothetical protein